MTAFDSLILGYLNRFIGTSDSFDQVVLFMASSHPVKMGPLILILWGFWFVRDENTIRRRKDVFLAFFGSFVAMAMARGLALTLPFRLRPLHNPDLALHIPNGMSRGTLDGWSSLPSDHAALAFAIATGIFLIHRIWGTLALLHAALIICLPRAYLALHYPTDLIVGAMVGIFCSWGTMRIANTKTIVHHAISLENARPAIFYTIFLLIASQMIAMFDDTREIASEVIHMVFKWAMKMEIFS